ncbi:MAG: type II CAAX endopeptidase family protein [Candidatus Bathyarchaeia archaeon]
MSISAFIKRHPVATYYALVFAISWGGLLIVIGPGGIPGIMEQTMGNSLFWSVYVVTIAGPSIAGILLTVFVYGKAGLHDIVSRLFKWKVGARWYAVAILTPALSVMATLFVLSIFSLEFLPGILTTGDKVSLVLFSLVAGVVTPFFEELGWTGFAVPQLSKRYGVLTTGLIVGFLWGAWHFLSNLYGVGISSGTLPLTLFMPAILFSFLPPYRVLMVWVYDRTKSLFVAMIMHGSLDTFWLIATPMAIAGVNLVTWYIAWAVVLWVLVAAVFVTKEGHLSH